MGLHAGLREGAPMALIVCVGSFTGGDFWVESFGLLNPSLREKKRYSRVCKDRAVEGWALKASPESPGVVQHQGTTRSIATGGRAMECDFLQSAGGGSAAVHAYVAAAACGHGFYGVQCLLQPLQLVRTNLCSAGAPENRSQEAQDTAHAKQHTERTHR